MNWFRSLKVKWTLFGIGFGLVFPIAGTLISIWLVNAPVSWERILTVQRSEPILWIIDLAPFVLGMVFFIIGIREHELNKLNQELKEANQHLRDLTIPLDESVRLRTEELTTANEQLARRSSQLQAITEVIEKATAIRSFEKLVPEIVELISSYFNFYHVGIFMTDSEQKNMVLAAANSEGGKRMLQRNHTLPVGLGSIVGYATITRQPRIALDVGMDAVFFNNPDLPETRSEMALPLLIGDRVFGVLDVQSTESNAFSPDDIRLLETLANQVTIVIENARLFSESQHALTTAEGIYQRYFGVSWNQFIRQSGQKGYRFSNGKIIKEDISQENVTPEIGTSIPLMIRDQVIGRLDIQPKTSERQFSEDEMTLVRAVAERAALALDNSRLLVETQRRAAHERLVSQVTMRLRESMNVESILQNAARELHSALGDVETEVWLDAENSTNVM